jgi:hypothetical protein
MMTPVGKKATLWALDDIIRCPPAVRIIIVCF